MNNNWQPAPQFEAPNIGIQADQGGVRIIVTFKLAQFMFYVTVETIPLLIKALNDEKAKIPKVLLL